MISSCKNENSIVAECFVPDVFIWTVASWSILSLQWSFLLLNGISSISYNTVSLLWRISHYQSLMPWFWGGGDGCSFSQWEGKWGFLLIRHQKKATLSFSRQERGLSIHGRDAPKTVAIMYHSWNRSKKKTTFKPSSECAFKRKGVRNRANQTIVPDEQGHTSVLII